jgi:phage gp29-like protein
MTIELADQQDQEQKKVTPITQDVAVVGLYDRFSSYPSQGLTPERLASIFIEADSGDVFRQMELFEEVLEKDPHIASIFQARRLAVSGKNYNIVPASDSPKDIEIAGEVERLIKRIRGWQNTLNDMLDAVPKGFSVLEIYWIPKDGKYTISKLKHKHQKKFRFGQVTDLDSDPEEIRLIVDPRHIDRLRGLVPDSELGKAAIDGISLESTPALRRRFAILLCRARSGNPARTSLLRTLTYLYLFKNYDVKWWVQFAEKMLGYVVGKYDSGQPDQKELLEQAIMGLSTDAAAVISKDSAIEFAEMATKAASHQVYGDLARWCNEEATKVVLGHTGTNQSTPGKLGGEDNAKEVKEELVQADALAMDECITDEIIIPFIIFNFGEQEEYPYYKTDISESPDLRDEAELDLKLQDMGFPLTKNYVKEKYGRPLPDPKDTEDEVLVPRQGAPNIVAAKDSRVFVGSRKKKLLSRR